MQIAPARKLPDGDAWSYEAKLDGYWCLAAKRSAGVLLWSRRGNGFTTRFPEIARACEKLPPNTLIDGEVVAIDESGRVSFNALQHSRANAHLQFYVFDILVHRGRSLLPVPQESRHELLEEALEKVGYPVLRGVRGQACRVDPGREELELRESSLSERARSMNRGGPAARRSSSS
jgi:bifunctional non-homologous end joining protein LigD